MLTAIAHLWVGGVSIDWARFHDGERRRRVVLPTYPFERKRYWIEPRKSSMVTAAPRVEKPAKAPLADWFYIPSWKRSMTAAPAANGAGSLPQPRWMLFADDAGLADRVERFLTAAGHDVIVVEPGRRFERLTDRRYAIDPATASHYTSLFQGLASEGRLPGVIGHMWGYTGETPVEPRDSATCHERGFYSLLFLTQALGELGTSQPIVLGVVTTDVQEVTGDETLCPSKATAARSVPRDPGRVCERHVPGRRPGGVGMAAGRRPADRHADRRNHVRRGRLRVPARTPMAGEPSKRSASMKRPNASRRDCATAACI